jgi:hypothetical protein
MKPPDGVNLALPAWMFRFRMQSILVVSQSLMESWSLVRRVSLIQSSEFILWVWAVRTLMGVPVF